MCFVSQVAKQNMVVARGDANGSSIIQTFKPHDSSSAMQRLIRPLKLVFFICKCAGILWTSGWKPHPPQVARDLWIQLKCDGTFTLLPLASWFNLSHLDDVMFFCNNNYIINLLFPGTTSSLWLLAAYNTEREGLSNFVSSACDSVKGNARKILCLSCVQVFDCLQYTTTKARPACWEVSWTIGSIDAVLKLFQPPALDRGY